LKEMAGRQPALDYLSLWASARDQWKFQKVRQVYLLTHMYEKDKAYFV